MSIDHRLLNRVQTTACATQMLDCNHMTAIETCQKTNTGIHRLIAQAHARKPPHKHGTSTAIALGAALFRTSQPLRNSQKIKQSILRANCVKPHILTIQQKSDLVSRQRHSVTFPKTSCAEFTSV
jgi:hypothetical protein